MSKGWTLLAQNGEEVGTGTPLSALVSEILQDAVYTLKKNQDQLNPYEGGDWNPRTAGGAVPLIIEAVSGWGSPGSPREPIRTPGWLAQS